MRIIKMLLISLTMLYAVTASATLSTIGQKGMLQTITAENEGKGIIGIGGYGQYWQSSVDLLTLTSDYKRGIGNYFVSYVPYNVLEVFIAQAAGAYQQENPAERNVGVGDTYLGAKYTNKLRGFAQWGISSSIRMPTGEPEYGLGTTAFENTFLLSLDLSGYDITPFKLHFNIGYVKTGESEPETYEASDALIIRSAVVLPSRIFSPFIEY
ncbi:MAG: hypothetical protein E3J78_04725, partial [Candidatus Cloacimonadota bacterium]